MIRKIIAILQAGLQVWVPVCLLSWSVFRPQPTWADRFSDAARQGQALGLGLVPDPSTLAGQDPDGNINLHFKGKTSTFKPEDLFSDQKNVADPHADTGFGNDADVINKARNQIESLDGSSRTGQAYWTLADPEKGVASRARTNLSSDPLWNLTDDVITDVLAGEYGDCEIVLTSDPKTTKTHVPDYRTCERVKYPGGSCKCRHDYSVEFVAQYGVSVTGHTGEDGGSFRINVQTGTILSTSGTVYGLVVTSPPPPVDLCEPAEEGFYKTVAIPSVGDYQSGYYIFPTCENGTVASLYIHNTAGSHNDEVHNITIVLNRYHIVDRGWTCDPGCEVFLTDIGGNAIIRPRSDCTTHEVCEDVLIGMDELGNPIYERQCHDEEICTSPYSCSLGPCETATSISGAWISQGDLYSTNPFASVGISNLAHEVTIQLQNFNQGVINPGVCAGIDSKPECTFVRQECVCASGWADSETGLCPDGACDAQYNVYACGSGEVRCYNNLGTRHDTCAALESNPACSYVRQECIEGAKDPESGACYAWDVIYDCGFSVSRDDPGTTISYICNGVVKCMGEGCVPGLFDPNNTGFARATALLQAVKFGAADTDCTSGARPLDGGCKIWTGEAITCKKALGGYINCCEQPEGVSLVSYIKLLTESFSLMSVEWNLTGVLPDMLATNPLNGAWSLISDYDPWTFMKDAFSSAWDSLVGVSEPATGAGGTLFSETLTQKLMSNAYDLVESISPDLAEAIFEVGDITGEVIFSEGMNMLMSAVSFIMWIYTIYQILDILVHIIWQCEKEELELGVKKQLKVCHYLGSYCESDILGVCIEKRESYCCYKSPLARIMQEQIRNQINHWGDAEEPNCGGLTPNDLARVDWSKVNLDEWLALLNIAGEYPTQKRISLDGLTGSGSQFNFGNTTNPRPDTGKRTQDRINESGEDLEQLRIEGGLEMWGMGGEMRGGSHEKRRRKQK